MIYITLIVIGVVVVFTDYYYVRKKYDKDFMEDYYNEM